MTERAEHGDSQTPAVTGPPPAASLNTKPRAVAKNALSGYATLVLGALIGVVVTPIMLRQLGTAGFGTWSLVLGTAGYVALLEAGLGTASTTRVAAVELDGPDDVGRVLSTSLALCACAGALGLVVTVALAAVFPSLFSVPADLASESQIAILLAGAAQAITVSSTVFTAALLGTGRMYMVNFSGFVISATATVVGAIALLAGGGIEALAVIQFASAVLTVLVFRRRVVGVLPGVTIAFRGFDRPAAKRLLSLGWRNSVSSVAGVLAFGSDIVLVGVILDAKAAAAYAIALRGYALLQRVATGVLGAIGPTHAHAAHHASSRRRFEVYCLATQATLCLAIYGGLTVGMFASPLLGLWLGNVPGNAASVLVVLCVVLVLQAPGMNAASLLVNSERSGQLMRISVSAALVNITGSIAFTLTSGDIGPALGSLVAVALFDTIFLPSRICALLGEPYPAFVRRTFVPLVLPVLALLAVLVAGRMLVDEGPYILVVAGLGAVAYFGSLWHLPAGRQVRSLLTRRGLTAA